MGTPRSQAKARTGPDVATEACTGDFVGYVVAKVEADDPSPLFFDFFGPFGIVVGFFSVKIEQVVPHQDEAHNAFGQEWIRHATFELHHVVV